MVSGPPVSLIRKGKPGADSKPHRSPGGKGWGQGGSAEGAPPGRVWLD